MLTISIHFLVRNGAKKVFAGDALWSFGVRVARPQGELRLRRRLRQQGPKGTWKGKASEDQRCLESCSPFWQRSRRKTHPSFAPLVTSGSPNMKGHGMLTCCRTRASAGPSSCMGRSRRFATSIFGPDIVS
eukprot:4668532-Amphidinium_carterae.1